MHAQTRVHSVTVYRNGKTSLEPAYEVCEKREKWPEPVYIFGSGPTIHVSDDESKPVWARRPVDTLTADEYEAYLRLKWPYQWEYREGMRRASLDSAAL